jgi:hypothetical protein
MPKPVTKSISISLLFSNTLLGRFMSVVDRLLMANAKAALRNGDLPYFGL